MMLTGHRLTDTLAPGSPDWWTKMSASKVAAVRGHSRWESRFSLWHKMAGNVPPEPQTDEQARGHYLEPAIRAWFADQHPDWTIATSGTWQHNHRTWQIASPDGEVHKPDDELAVLECKTDAELDPEWGDEHTDQIPLGYEDQVMWTLDTLGATTAHVVLLGAFLSFREYIVHYDPQKAARIREDVIQFMDSLPSGSNPQQPDLDNHTATYQAIRHMNPNILDFDVELTGPTARRYLAALDQFDAATAEKTGATAQVAKEIGENKNGTYQGIPIATRQQRKTGTPFIKQTGKRPTETSAAA